MREKKPDENNDAENLKEPLLSNPQKSYQSMERTEAKSSIDV